MSNIFKKLSVFVNSCDDFEDCWLPFFTLFAKNWNNCKFPIFLNTETKKFSYKHLEIISTKVSIGNKIKLSWSECLEFALNKVKTKYILYLQEDYFLEYPVKVRLIYKLIKVMQDENIDLILLAKNDSIEDNKFLYEVRRNARFRISLQPGIWKVSYLKSILRAHEDAWQFESYASRRSHKSQDKIYTVNQKFFDLKNMIYPYKKTGITAGKWMEHIVVPLFKKNSIYVDYSVRGFHTANDRNKKRKGILVRLWDKLRSF